MTNFSVLCVRVESVFKFYLRRKINLENNSIWIQKRLQRSILKFLMSNLRSGEGKLEEQGIT